MSCAPLFFEILSGEFGGEGGCVTGRILAVLQMAFQEIERAG